MARKKWRKIPKNSKINRVLTPKEEKIWNISHKYNDKLYKIGVDMSKELMRLRDINEGDWSYLEDLAVLDLTYGLTRNKVHIWETPWMYEEWLKKERTTTQIYRDNEKRMAREEKKKKKR